MATSYAFEPENRLCVWKMTGVLDADAIIATVRTAHSDPLWSNDYDFLTLLTEARLGQIQPEDSDRIVEALGALDTPSTDGHAKRGAIVCTDELASALLLYYEQTSRVSRASEERIFTDEAEARAWLASPAA